MSSLDCGLSEMYQCIDDRVAEVVSLDFITENVRRYQVRILDVQNRLSPCCWRLGYENFMTLVEPLVIVPKDRRGIILEDNFVILSLGE